MKFEQKRRGIHVEYVFGETTFDYTLSDRTGEFQKAFPYESVDVKHPHTFRASSSKLLILVSWLAGVFFILLALLTHETRVQILSGFFGALFISVVYALRFGPGKGVKQTIFKTGETRIKVLDGKDHDAIVDQLNRGWKERVRALYAAVDFSNDPNKEAQKFRWLRDNGVIEEHECETALKRIAAAHAASATQANDASLIN